MVSEYIWRNMSIREGESVLFIVFTLLECREP